MQYEVIDLVLQIKCFPRMNLSALCRNYQIQYQCGIFWKMQDWC